MYFAIKCICINKINSKTNLGIYNVPRKNINESVNKLINKCSNPLNYHKKSCIAFWNYVDKFNEDINTVKYEIEQMTIKNDNTESYFDLQSCIQNDDTFIADECKIYDN